MYKIKVLYKDKTRKVLYYKSLQDLKQGEESLLKLQGEAMKMYAKYEVVNGKETLL